MLVLGCPFDVKSCHPDPWTESDLGPLFVEQRALRRGLSCLVWSGPTVLDDDDDDDDDGGCSRYV